MIRKLNRFFNKCKYSISWAVFMFNNRDWESSFLYEMIHKKILSMADYLDNHGHTIYSKRYALLARICAKHLDLYLKDDSDRNLCTLFDKKYGEIDMITKPYEADKDYMEMVGWEYSKCKTPEEYAYADKLRMRIAKIGNRQTEKHFEKFMYVFKKYSRMWYD